MIAIGSSADQSGNGMFSTSARKLNMLFMNLKERSPLIPNPFVNRMRRCVSQQPPKQSHQHSTDEKKKKMLAATRKTIFESSVPREVVESLELKKVTTPFYGNYNPRLVERKVKMMRNYVLENPESDFRSSFLGALVSQASANRPQEFKLDTLRSNFRLRRGSVAGKNGRGSLANSPPPPVKFIPICEKFCKENALIDQENTHRSEKIALGMIDFNLQTPRPSGIRLSYFKPTDDLTNLYSALKRVDAKADLQFRNGASQQRFKEIPNRRHNYELEIKRAVVQKRTDLVVPDFERDHLQRPQTCRDFCLNKDFYDLRYPDRHIRTPSLSKMMARK